MVSLVIRLFGSPRGLSGRLFNIEQPSRHARSYARPLPRKARPDMALERDNAAERLARIDKLTADMKPVPAQQQITRLHASLMVVSLPPGPSLDTRDLPEAETKTRGL